MTTCVDNINPLYNNPFKIVFGRGTNQMEFMVQKANLPGISLNDTPQPTTLGTTIPIPTMAVVHEPLVIEFIVDSNLANWKSLYSWMRNLSNIADDTTYNLNYQDWHYQASLFVYDPVTKYQPSGNCTDINLEVRFWYIIPVALSGVNFQADSVDLAVQKATCKFKYSYYEFVPNAPGDLS
jgi:hypothetical protein